MAALPNFIYSDPNAAPVALQGQPGPAAETAYQVSNGEYFFQLASGGSANRNNFKGPVVIENPNASLVVQGPVTTTQLITGSITNTGFVNVSGNGATISAGSAPASITGGAISISTTLGGSGIQVSSQSSVSLNAVTSVSVTAATGVNITGNEIAFLTTSDASAVPMTVQYGDPGDVGYLYDTKLNPVIGPGIIIGTYQPGLSITFDGPITVPHTGYYILSSTVYYAPSGGAAVSFPATNYFTACITATNTTYAPLPGSAVTFSGFGWTGTGSAPVQETRTGIVFLTAGTPYYSDLAQVGTISLAGNGSGVGFQQSIQPLGCSYS